MFALKIPGVSVFRSFRRVFPRRASSSLAQVSVLKKKTLPEGISFEVFDERHDISRIRQLLAKAFVENNEPIVHALGELYYPTLPARERFPLIEEKFKKLYSVESLQSKLQDGLSVVAVKDNNPGDVVSVFFAQRYKGEVYQDVDVPICQTAVNFVRAVHEKAIPVLQCCDPNATVFVSHLATHPDYRSMGIVEQAYVASMELFLHNGIRNVFGITSAERLSRSAIRRYGFQIIAEVFYKDYEDGGQKVFEKLADKEVSGKAIIAYL